MRLRHRGSPQAAGLLLLLVTDPRQGSSWWSTRGLELQLEAPRRNHKARGCLLVFRPTPKAWVAVMNHCHLSDSVVDALGVPCPGRAAMDRGNTSAAMLRQRHEVVPQTADPSRPFVDKGGDQTVKVNTGLTCKGLRPNAAVSPA